MKTPKHLPCRRPLFVLHSIFTILAIVLLLLPGSGASAGSAAVGRLAPADVPTLNIFADLNLPVDTTAAISPEEHLHAYAPGYGSSDLVYTLVAGPTQGELLLNTQPLADGGTFTQEDIDNYQVSYAAPDAVGTDHFTFHVAAGADVTEDLAFTIHVNKAEPSAYPTGFTATANSASQITVTWTDAASGPAADGYVVVCSPSGWPHPPLDTGYAIENPCTDGSGSVHVAPGVQSYTWEGLNSETTYYFAIFPYAHTLYPEGNGEYFDYYTALFWPAVEARTLLTYSIQGMVTDGAFPILGALIDAGNGLVAYSGEDGSYTLTGLTPGNYSLSISLPCYTFTPPQRSVSVDDANNHVTGQDFTGTRHPCIYGAVYEGAQPLAGVTIGDDSSATAATTESGDFSVMVPNGWSGSLAPAKINYFFTPDRRTYANVIADQYLQNFTGHRVAVQPTGFVASWNDTPGAVSYLLEVATDPNFTALVPGYQSLDVGAVTEYNVTGLSPQTHYYYRVRPHNYANMGDYSQPVEVLTTLPVYLPLVVYP